MKVLSLTVALLLNETQAINYHKNLKYKQSISLAQIDNDLKELTENHHTLSEDQVKLNLAQLENRMKTYQEDHPAALV